MPAFLLLVGLHWVGAASAARPEPLAALAANPDLIPARVGAWERREFAALTRDANNYFGEHSHVWVYARPGLDARVSLDWPFPGWHDLTWCYRGTGWQIDAQEVLAHAQVPDGFVAVRMSKPGYRYGYLLFCEFDRRGTPFRSRPGGTRDPLFRHETTLTRVSDRLAGRPAPEGDPAGAAYQFQVWFEGPAPLTPEGEVMVRELFVAAQAQVRKEWAAGK
jgi:hypothetical protein